MVRFLTLKDTWLLFILLPNEGDEACWGLDTADAIQKKIKKNKKKNKKKIHPITKCLEKSGIHK